MNIETQLLKAASAVGATDDDVLIEEVAPARLRLYVDIPDTDRIYVRLLPVETPAAEARSLALVRSELPAHR